MSIDYTLEESEFLGLPVKQVKHHLDATKLETHDKPYSHIIVHHTGSRDYTMDELLGFHMDKLGMGAIGYHFAIDQKGGIYYTRDLAFKGAHAFPNTGKIGIALMRSFDEVEPNVYEVESLKLLIDKLKLITTDERVLGHNQDQLVELHKRNPSIIIPEDLLPLLLLPKSKKDFDKGKEGLSLANKGSEISLGLDASLVNFKTCPGIMAYRGAMQYVS